ncbi:MAG: hypothetical protein KDJ38_19065 [Gammaproteobacteria bacterium]|nr:hypothetical protein [Gammaproteobacteria bacterium]
MDPKLKQELYESYHSLLDRFRYVYEEGKESLEDALHIAAQELQKLGDHTDEEIHHLSDVLKDDMREASLQAHELKEGLREIIDFDRQYLSTEIREKVLKLADQTTLDMLALREELAERQRRRNSTPKNKS